MSTSTDDVKIVAALLADEEEFKKKIRKFWLHPINEIIISSYLPLPIVMFVTSTYYKVLHTFSLPKLTLLHP
jgi:hypothetical protein